MCGFRLQFTAFAFDFLFKSSFHNFTLLARGWTGNMVLLCPTEILTTSAKITATQCRQAGIEYSLQCFCFVYFIHQSIILHKLMYFRIIPVQLFSILISCRPSSSLSSSLSYLYRCFFSVHVKQIFCCCDLDVSCRNWKCSCCNQIWFSFLDTCGAMLDIFGLLQMVYSVVKCIWYFWMWNMAFVIWFLFFFIFQFSVDFLFIKLCLPSGVCVFFTIFQLPTFFASSIAFQTYGTNGSAAYNFSYIQANKRKKKKKEGNGKWKWKGKKNKAMFLLDVLAVKMSADKICMDFQFSHVHSSVCVCILTMHVVQ